jgi:hypothetical protein
MSRFTAITVSPLLAHIIFNHAAASTTSIGIDGIHANGLTLPNGLPLNGDGIQIGQVETFRPAVPMTDTAANADVHPATSTLLDGQALFANMDLGDGHATRVASVMISTDKVDSNANGDAPQGVAPAAELHSSGYLMSGNTTVA